MQWHPARAAGAGEPSEFPSPTAIGTVGDQTSEILITPGQDSEALAWKKSMRSNRGVLDLLNGESEGAI